MRSPKSMNIGVEEHFRRNAATHPYADAVVEGGRIVSYGELDSLAAQFALQLRQYNPTTEEPIGILLPKGIASIIAQIAIVRVGASCVPLDLDFPNQRIHKLYNNLGVRIVVTNLTHSHRAPASYNTVLTDNHLVARTPDRTTKEDTCIVPTGSEHRIYVLHTSGTTGEPKGVEILSRGIMYLANNTVVAQMDPTDRVAQFAAPSFDVTLQEIWATLVVGGAVVMMSKEVLMDPYALREVLQKDRVTGIVMTLTLMQFIVSVIPHAFAGLEWVVTGGEPANPKGYQAIFNSGPPKILSNAYGPTESFDCLNPKIPIGKPVNGVTLRILDDNRVPVRGTAIGELYIEGGTISRGYYNRPDATASRFRKNVIASGQTEHLFRTGDLARYTEAGDIDFIGRNDDLVKIYGRRIDTTEIRTAMLDSGVVTETIVPPVSRPGKETYIVAFTIPRQENSLSAQKLDDHLKQLLPEYMMPRVEFVPFLPMTPHGKADRKLLVSTHISAGEEAEKKRSTLKSDTETPRTWLKQLWTTVLGIREVEDESHFFDSGGSSLQAAALLMHIRRRFNVRITMQQMYDAPILQQLADLIEEVACSRNHKTSRIDVSKLDVLKTDSELACKITVPTTEIPHWRTANYGGVFLTGATGFLGAHMLRDLIVRPDVNEVRCLVRAADAQVGRLRLISSLREVGVTDDRDLHEVVAVPGGLGIENFGLTGVEFAGLAAWADTIFHNGAHISCSQPYEKHRAANVIGTLSCIRLAVMCRLKSLHYVSTAGVTGPTAAFTNPKRIMEDVNLDDFQTSLPYDLGYTQSKWVAEKMVSNMQKKGLSAVIYRPGFVMGDGVNGKVNHVDLMSRFYRSCLQMGYRPALPGQGKAVVTPDFTSAAIIHIASNPVNHGQAFHIVPQTHEEDPDLDRIWAILEEIGYPCSSVAFKDWIDHIYTDANVLENPLFSVLPTLQEIVYNGRTRWELYENMAPYDITNYKTALADMEYDRKSGIDRDFMVNYMRELTAKSPIVRWKNI